MKSGNENFDIVMFNMSDYREWSEEGIVNRNYHILHNLLKRDEIGKILAIDFLPHTISRGIKSFFKNRLSAVNKAKLLKNDYFSQLYHIDQKLYHYQTISTIYKRGEKSVYKNINSIISKYGFKNNIVWSYIPTFTNYYKNIIARYKIFDAVDNWAEHPSYEKIKILLSHNYKIIDEVADHVFTVSKDLKNIFKNNKSVHWIPNGVDINHFKIRPKIENNDLSEIKKPIIGYAGIIQKRVDVELIKYLAENNKDKNFVFVGMVWPDAKYNILDSLENVIFLGQRPYDKLPEYISQFDVAIIPHRINEFTRSMNPLKLYEYLACGKPVVSTPIAGTENFKNLIEIAGNKEEFNKKLNLALSSNNKSREDKRRISIERYSWRSRVDRMMKIIINS